MELLVDKNREYRRYRLTISEKIQLANIGLQHVLSSNVSAVGVNDKDLIIRFHNGSLYKYYNKGDLFDSMMRSNSKGHFVWVKLRKPRVPYTKIGTLPFKEDDTITDEQVMDLVDNEGVQFEERLRNMGMFIPTIIDNPLGLIDITTLVG